MARQPTIAGLHRRLTTIFNRYIRLRDSNGDGTFNCISCGQNKPVEHMDAGHFISSKHYIHKYSERNVSGQCTRCNRFEHGNLIGYFIGLQNKYGETVPYDLWASHLEPAAYTREQLQHLIGVYTNKVETHT